MGKWYRVNKKQRCPKCGRPDWCSFTDDSAVCCMRIESDHPIAAGGWLHRLDDGWVRPKPVRQAIQDKPLDAQGTWKRWQNRTDSQHLDGFAMSLGVTTESLTSIGCAWGEGAWGFPMRNEREEVIGIRLRSDDGHKWAVKGSKQGLFVPFDMQANTMAIAEGPTDTAAAISLGMFTIGRPSCLGCEDMTNAFIKRKHVQRVIILADSDGPGMRGAEKLQSSLSVPSCMFIPPAKDIRAFIGLGGDAAMLNSMLKDLVWQTPNDKKC